MTAQIIEFPSKPDDTPDCRNCVKARFGSTTFCTMFNESVLDEQAAAADCGEYTTEEIP